MKRVVMLFLALALALTPLAGAGTAGTSSPCGHWSDGCYACPQDLQCSSNEELGKGNGCLVILLTGTKIEDARKLWWSSSACETVCADIREGGCRFFPEMRLLDTSRKECEWVWDDETTPNGFYAMNPHDVRMKIGKCFEMYDDAICASEWRSHLIRLCLWQMNHSKEE